MKPAMRRWYIAVACVLLALATIVCCAEPSATPLIVGSLLFGTLMGRAFAGGGS